MPIEVDLRRGNLYLLRLRFEVCIAHFGDRLQRFVAAT